MKKPVKIILAIVALIAAGAGGAYYMMMPIPLRMTPITAQTAELSFMEQGVVRADNVVRVFPIAQGEINGLYVQEGQSVSAGDPLLSVDATALHLRLGQVQSGIRSLEAQLANVSVEEEALRQNLQATQNRLRGELRAVEAQASESDRLYASGQEAQDEQLRIQLILIEQHYNDAERARENYQRIESLFQSGIATLAEYELAQSAVAIAETQLEAAQGQMALIAAGTLQNTAEHFQGVMAAINAQITGIDQQLAQDTTTAVIAHFEALIAVEQANLAQIEREIANALITAPTTGIITALQAQNTNFISAAAPVAEITIPGRMSINVYVSTQDLGSIALGDTVRLTLRQRLQDIYFQGTITEIDSTAVVRLSPLGIEERKVNVEIAPEIPQGVQLGIGHALDVTFYIFREENRLLVPRTAVFRDGGEYRVWVVRGGDSGAVEAAPVVTGLELRTDVIIESGLNPGDFVINDANNPDLSNGTRVINER